MGWEHDLARRLRDNRPRQLGQAYIKGSVISPKWDDDAEDWVRGELIVSILDGNAMLTAGMLEQLPQSQKLHDGMTVALLPGPVSLSGGARLQKFLILGVVSDAV